MKIILGVLKTQFLLNISNKSPVFILTHICWVITCCVSLKGNIIQLSPFTSQISASLTRALVCGLGGTMETCWWCVTCRMTTLNPSDWRQVSTDSTLGNYVVLMSFFL